MNASGSGIAGIGAAASHGPPSVLRPAGPLADALADVATVLIGGAVVVFVAMIILTLAALRARPRQPGDEADLRRFTWRWIGSGTAFPVIVLSALLLHATWQTARFAAAGRQIAADPATLLVTVEARMWWWEVRYRQPGSAREEIVTANEIRLPADRPIRLALTATDVIHSFWVPALAGKVDMLPGRFHHLELDRLPPGTYRGQCAEYCGEQHARMALQVVVEPADAFERWLASQRLPAQLPSADADPVLQRGLAVFRETRCGACHTIRGLTGRSDGGPDLTHVGSRRHLGAGTLPNDDDALERWLVDIQEIKSGARMPSYRRLPPEDRTALARFLGALQ
ncbi:MAG: c-type cytochrome [Lautropia sp.]